jgi:hypothetical protein
MTEATKGAHPGAINIGIVLLYFAPFSQTLISGNNDRPPIETVNVR